jgi:hypothetical protein
MRHWLFESVDAAQKKQEPEKSDQDPAVSEPYDPEKDPNWEYQGRSPRQVASNNLIGSISMVALAFFLFVVGIYYVVVRFLGG